MAITINDFSIIDNGDTMSINVETAVNETITSILLWQMNDFKDYASAINLNYKLEQTSNIESFIVTAAELNLKI